jgi:protein SCO1/2
MLKVVLVNFVLKNNKMRYSLLFFILLAFFACEIPNPKKLGFQGVPQYETKIVNGDTVKTEIPFKVSKFRFLNQDSVWVTNETFKNKIYVVDFFFTTCPSICPKMTKQMLRIHDAYKDDETVGLLSHSIDYINDSVAVLADYARKIGIKTSEKWHFVVCDRDQTYAMAKEYMNTAVENENAPGGYEHSGYLVLVDKNGHLRSYCDGTDPEKVDIFIEDIQLLLNEMNDEK